MKKSILNLGNTLNKVEQKAINGGEALGACDANGNCPTGQFCEGGYCYLAHDDNCTGPWQFCPDGSVSCIGC